MDRCKKSWAVSGSSFYLSSSWFVGEKATKYFVKKIESRKKLLKQKMVGNLALT